jgi:hypothetical protein
MKKVRINTSLRRKLENYVRSQIDAAMDTQPLEDARTRLEAEALRIARAAFPADEMRTLAKYGKTTRYARLSFAMPDGQSRDFEFSAVLPYDLPRSNGFYFDDDLPADEAFAATAQEVADIEAAQRMEAKRQWKQAEVLVNCALYFEDVLDFLAIPEAERVNLCRRWSVQTPQPEPSPEEDIDASSDEEADENAPSPPAAPKLLTALNWLLDDLTDAGEDRDQETGREYDSVAYARAVVIEARAA